MAGMLNLGFGVPQTPEQEDERQRQQAMQYAGLTSPTQQGLYEIARAGQNIVSGTRGLLGAGLSMATGKDVDLRSPGQQRADSIAKVREAMANVSIDPEDPKSLDNYYSTLIRALGANGLTNEAAQVAGEYQQRRSQAAKDALAATREARMSREGQAKLDLAKQKIEIDAQKAQAVGPKALYYIRAIEAAQNQLAANPDDAAAQEKIQTLKQLLDVELAGKGFKLEKLNDRYVVVNTTTGDVTEGGPMGEKPPSAKQAAKHATDLAAAGNAYNAAASAAQQNYDAAVALYNHPGLDQVLAGITGAIGAKPVDSRSFWQNLYMGLRLSPAGQQASGLLDQVKAGAFIKALQELKAAGRNGSTGLGSLTEVEGAKIQAAQANLNSMQDPARFRDSLKTYIQSLVEDAAELDSAAQASGIAAIRPLKPKQLTESSSQRRDADRERMRKPAAAKAPEAAPAAPEATGKDFVPMTRPDGRNVLVHPDDVQEALSKEYKRR